MIEMLLFVIGCGYLIKGVAHMSECLRVLLKGGAENYGKGSWVLVTACTDGIGLGFAIELAKRGFNIIQVSRNSEKMNQSALKLTSLYKIEVKNIVKDFSHCCENPNAFFNDIFNQCRDLDISLLINNIGATEIGPFHSNLQSILTQNALNLFPITYLTRLMLSKLKSRKNGAGIINMSSLTAEYPIPLMSVYSAGKSFCKQFSSVLSAELKGTSVDVLCYEPGYVWTPLGSKFKFKFAAVSKEQCASIGISALGKIETLVGHWSHLACFFCFWLTHLLFGYFVLLALWLYYTPSKLLIN